MSSTISSVDLTPLLKKASKLEKGDKSIEIVQSEKQRGKIINETEHPKAVEKNQMI